MSGGTLHPAPLCRAPLRRVPEWLRGLAGRLGRCSRGDMVLISAGMLVAVTAVGFGVDYGRAAALQARMAEAGHAAAMAAVSPGMMARNDASASAAATALFVGQVSGLTGLVFKPNSGLSVVVSDVGSAGGISGDGDTGTSSGGASSGGGTGRQVVVRWSAAYTTLFGGLFGTSSLPITGSATAEADGAANVNFTVAMAPAFNGLQQAARGLTQVAQNLADQNRVTYNVLVAANGALVARSYGAVLSALDGGLSEPGDGATPSTAQSVVLLATDGSPGVPSADDLATCTALKNRGITIGVLYAPTASVLGSVVGSVTSVLETVTGSERVAAPGAVAEGLQACASPQMGGAALFVQQAPGQSVGDAMKALFARAAANARLVH